MPAHLRVSLPDRPGALAAVTRGLAAAGANVRVVMVLQRESGRAVDDVLFDWPFERPWDTVLGAIEACAGARVHGLRQVADVTPVADADLLLQIARRPSRAVETLIDALPATLLADWAAVCDRRWPREPVYGSTEMPLTLPSTPAAVLRPRILSGDGPPVLTVPCADDLRVLVGRRHAPGFTRSELDRYAALVAATEEVAASAYRSAVRVEPACATGRVVRLVRASPSEPATA